MALTSRQDRKSANFERRARVDVRDTRAAVEGEGIIFWRDRIVPVSMFYHGLDEKAIISDYPVTRLLDVNLPERGYGKTLLQPDNPIAASLKKAVRDGLSIDVDPDSIPDIPETSSMPALDLDKALPDFRRLVQKNPNLSVMDRDGLLFQLLNQYRDAQLTASLDDHDAGGRSPMDNAPRFNNRAQSDTQARQQSLSASQDTLKTLAPPEEAEHQEGFGNVNADEIKQAMTAIDDEQAAMELLNEPAAIKAPLAPPETTAAESSDRVQASEQGMAASSLVASAPWVIDPRQLADRANRTIHPSEASLAAASAAGAARLEEALGTSPEQARQVGQETAHAVIRGFEYPSRETPTPAAPQNPAEEEIVVKDQARTINRMKAWVSSNG